MTINSVLFDLDGTLLDTAPDLVGALNAVRQDHALVEIPLEILRPTVGYGATAMIQAAFNLTESHPLYPAFLKDFLNHYEARVCEKTHFFPGIVEVLNHLDERKLPWGIVTNKPGRFAFDILKKMGLDQRAASIVCGDTLPRKKPDPDPLLHACRLMQVNPAECLYVGDAVIDVRAAKAAKIRNIVALYGYIHPDEDPVLWQADGYVKQPIEILDFLCGE